MTTATAPNQDFVSQSTQNETHLSDIEILQRVRQIRSSWSVAERLERRQAADKRFVKLLNALALDHQAA